MSNKMTLKYEKTKIIAIKCGKNNPLLGFAVKTGAKLFLKLNILIQTKNYHQCGSKITQEY